MTKNDNIITIFSRSIRPGYGLHPKFYHEVLGKRAKVDLEKGTALKKEHFE